MSNGSLKTIKRAVPDDSILLQSRGSVFGENVFLCTRGTRHSVRSAERIRELGFKWPDDVIQVEESVLKAFRPGGIAPAMWSEDTDPSKISSSIDMREYFASGISGLGIEVGAGASPFPIPLDCRVLYGDLFSYGKLIASLYPGQSSYELVIPDLITNFDNFDGVADNSLDFIIGCHVIEHTRNPIGSIISAHKKLKKGGKLLLVIPDMERTFDMSKKSNASRPFIRRL